MTTTPTPNPLVADTAIEYRGFKIARDGKYFMWHVTPLDGGPVPRALGGAWTNIELIKQAIAKYIDDVTMVASK